MTKGEKLRWHFINPPEPLLGVWSRHRRGTRLDGLVRVPMLVMLADNARHQVGNLNAFFDLGTDEKRSKAFNSAMNTPKYQSTYTQLLPSGLSPHSAQYYALIQSRLHSVIKQGKKISLRGAKPLPQDIVQSDPAILKTKMLKLDPSAILTTLQYNTGMQRLSQMEQLHPGQSKYMVQYPDGSTLTATIHHGTSEKTYLGSINKSKVSDVKPQGYQQSTFGSGSAYSKGSGYSVTVTLSTPGSYSQNSVFDISYTADPL